MKLTATAQSTSLFDLINAVDWAIEKIESKKVWNELNWMYWVEIKRDSSDVYVETVLDEATADSRPVDETTPIFAFNCQDLNDVFIMWDGDFYISIV